MFYGVDIGGTKTETVAFDKEMQVCWRKHVAMLVQDYELFFSTFTSLIDTVDWTTRTQGRIGIGMPGLVDRHTEKLLSSNVPCLTGRQVMNDLAHRLNRSVELDNDCCCSALPEAHTQQARQSSRISGVIIGTGTGGGLVIDGQLYRGRNRMVSEFGHLPLPATFMRRYHLPELKCGCGLQGCLERYQSSPGLLWLHKHFSGEQLKTETLLEHYRHGNASTVITIEVWTGTLGCTSAQLQLILDIDASVLGGGVSSIEEIYTLLPRAMSCYLFPGLESARVLPAIHGASSGARGTALLPVEQDTLIH